MLHVYGVQHTRVLCVTRQRCRGGVVVKHISLDKDFTDECHLM